MLSHANNLTNKRVSLGKISAEDPTQSQEHMVVAATREESRQAEELILGNMMVSEEKFMLGGKLPNGNFVGASRANPNLRQHLSEFELEATETLKRPCMESER